MPNFKEVHSRVWKHERMSLISVSVIFVVAVLAGVLFGFDIAIASLAGIALISIGLAKPEYLLAFLAVYLPFEPFLLKFVPDTVYVYARFSSEALIYVAAGAVVLKLLRGVGKINRTPMDLQFVLFVLVLFVSSILNALDPTLVVLGARQIIRFMIVFFAIVYLSPSDKFIKKLTVAMFAIVIFQSIIGLAQAFFGGSLDSFLLPEARRTFGEIQLTEGTVQFWDPGQRVFGTLGRYDRLGTFIAFFLLIASAMLYEKRVRERRPELWWLLVISIPALLLTYSRSSWFGFLLGFLFLGIIIKRDRRVAIAGVVGALVIAGYLLTSATAVNRLIDVPGQTITERFFEAFSYQRWRGEYLGLGRLYWIVQTPLKVIPVAPLFGHGPAQFGGGAVAALHATGVYDELGLPYGVYGTEGYIDNNWLSLWGETGTLGIIFYLWGYAALFYYSLRVYKKSEDPFTRSLALGFSAAMIAVSVNAFLATFLEVRTLAFYLWLYGGLVVVLGTRERIHI
ncbi:MAG: Lipid A core-O-antigen ligase [uncultured bacterium]|nr:MAG: Lipid A core-O-antigen ligase [uncultured bacterium]